MERQEFGARLRRLRFEAGLTQTQAARNAGVAANYWGEWESGATMPQARRVGVIAAAIGKPIAAIFAPEGAACVGEIVCGSSTFTRLESIKDSEALALEIQRLSQKAASLVAAEIRAELARRRDGVEPPTRRGRRPSRSKADQLASRGRRMIRQSERMNAAIANAEEEWQQAHPVRHGPAWEPVRPPTETA